MAKIHGAKLKGGSGSSTSSDVEGGRCNEIKDDLLMFRDPKEYEGLSKEERVKLTKEMKQRHKGIQFLGGKNG